MANRYFFDKRVMKRGWLKYFIIFLISFAPMLLFNIFVGKYIPQRWLRVLLNCVILLVFVVIGNVIAGRIYEKKDRKLEARIKAREAMNERKKQILADSYNQKRLQKQKLKEEKKKQVEGDISEISHDIDVKEIKDADTTSISTQNKESDKVENKNKKSSKSGKNINKVK